MRSRRVLSNSIALAFSIACSDLYADTATPVPLVAPAAVEAYQSGYGDSVEFGGPSAVSQELDTLNENRDSLYQLDPLQRGFDPWFKWKEGLNDTSNIKLGVNALMLVQHSSADASADKQRNSAGAIYRFQGSWKGYSSPSGNDGKLEWRLESRSDIGGDPSPQQFGARYAAALNTGFPYGNNFDTDLAVLNWTQLLNDGRAGIAVGRLAFDAYLDAFAFQSPYRGFLNRSFVFNPTLATTGAGALGAVAKGFVTDQVWLGAQIYDGNASNGTFDLDTFRAYEWLKAIEVGWTPDIGLRATDRIQFTYWEKDARHAQGVSAGDGVAVSASRQWTDTLLTFVRLGHSNGGAGVAAENAASLGFEYSPWSDRSWTVGAGWADPSRETHGERLDDEYVVETSYKFQLTKNFSLTPDVQLLLKPAKTPEEDRVWIAGVRAVLTM
ncbi:MAG: carbohydrate porin [Halioglobus sp.]